MFRNGNILGPGLTGKLCLQHEDLAKKCIAALARELEVSDDVAIRNNVIIVMCDLCVRYTTMVDRYIPNISMCLKDPNPFIRRQTLILLTNLLQVSRGLRHTLSTPLQERLSQNLLNGNAACRLNPEYCYNLPKTKGNSVLKNKLCYCCFEQRLPAWDFSGQAK